MPTPKVDSLMEMKNFKRKLFDIIPAAPGEAARPRALMYVDGDILPVGCMDKFLADAEAVPSVAMFADTWCSGCNTYCGGFILMRDVPETTECFAAWDRELSRDNYALYSKDQDALDAALPAALAQFLACAAALVSSLVTVVASSPLSIPLVGLVALGFGRIVQVALSQGRPAQQQQWRPLNHSAAAVLILYFILYTL